MSAKIPKNKDLPVGSEATQLPSEFVDRLTKPFSRFLRFESAGGAVLLLATIVALLLSNSPWEAIYEQAWETQTGFQFGSFAVTRSLREWLNEGFMTLFFFLVALELKRELVLGELNHPRKAALSIAAAIGGMIAPVSIYFFLQSGQPGLDGWGTVMTTDTAFVIGCLALVGSRIGHSLRVFMLSLAIVDDIGAILVVALGYSNDIAWSALAFAAIGILAVRIMALIGIRSVFLYSVMGVSIWYAVDLSGIHATITGVILGLMTPARRWVSDERLYSILRQVIAHPTAQESNKDTKDRKTLQAAETAARETLSPIERIEITLHPWVSFIIMPLFALANAGLPLGQLDINMPLTLAILSSFVLGKPLGILLFSWLAVRFQIAVRPVELSWRLIASGGMLAGIGFTMALFIAHMAFTETVLSSAKLGIFLASLVSAFVGTALLRVLSPRR